MRKVTITDRSLMTVATRSEPCGSALKPAGTVMLMGAESLERVAIAADRRAPTRHIDHARF
jgi:hypothetical protein